MLEPVANHAGQRILAVYGGASRHHQIDMLKAGRRDRRRHAAAADRPAEVRRGLVGRRRGRRPRRGRPDGRRRLHAAGRVDPAPLHGPLADDAVLGHARRRRRPPHPALPQGPGRGRHRLGHRHRGHDAPPVPGRAPHGQGPRRRRRSPRACPGWPCSARPSGCATRSPPRSRTSASMRRRSTATCRRSPASGRCASSPRASWPCSWPPTSPPAGSTSTTSAPSCTTTRRRTPRTTCTARAARRAPGATAGP